MTPSFSRSVLRPDDQPTNPFGGGTTGNLAGVGTGMPGTNLSSGPASAALPNAQGGGIFHPPPEAMAPSAPVSPLAHMYSDQGAAPPPMIKGEPTAGGWASPQSPMGAGMAAPATGPISTPLHGGPSMTVNQSMQNAPQTPGGGWASPDNSGGGSAAMAPPPINPVAQNYYAQGFQNRLRAPVMPTAPRMNAPYSSSTGYVPTFRPQNAY